MSPQLVSKSCPTCRSFLEPCPICETCSFCPICPAYYRDIQRHLEFCGKIQQQRAKYEALRSEEQEEQQPTQTRDEVRSKLAQETYALFRLMVEANYPHPLPVHARDVIHKLWAYPAIRGHWDSSDAKLVIPALHICQDQDFAAFQHVLDLINPYVATGEAGRYGQPPPFQGRGKRKNAICVLDNINALIRAEDESCYYRVPLVLIKLRLLFEIGGILHVDNQDRIENLREQESPKRIVLPRVSRSSVEVKGVINDPHLDERWARLRNEIRALAQFGGSMGLCWEGFWKHMCLPEDSPWRQKHPLDAAPEHMRKLIYANHHAWAGTIGARPEMGYLGLLGEDWAEQMNS